MKIPKNVWCWKSSDCPNGQLWYSKDLLITEKPAPARE